MEIIDDVLSNIIRAQASYIFLPYLAHMCLTLSSIPWSMPLELLPSQNLTLNCYTFINIKDLRDIVLDVFF